MSENANDLAFPEVDSRGNPWPGLTKREYFAAVALNGLIHHALPGASLLFRDTAQDAVGFADALSRELAKEPQE